MPITIRPELEAQLRARASAAGITVETYIEQMASNDQAAEEELEALVMAGLNSGEAIEVDERYWAEKRQRLIDRHAVNGRT